jgi:hypothetical protein
MQCYSTFDLKGTPMAKSSKRERVRAGKTRSGEEVTMSKTVKIEWDQPANIVSGTKLDETQLCAKARDEATGAEITAGRFDYSPKDGVELAPGTHKLDTTFYPDDAAAYATATQSVSITVVSSTVKINGLVKFDRDPKDPIERVCVTLNDRDCGKSTEHKTGPDGSYAFDARRGSNVSIEFPSIATFNGRTVALLDPQLTFLRPSQDIQLPVTRYISRGYEISGRVVRAPNSAPLAGATVTLHQPGANGDSAIAQATTDSNGWFSIPTEQAGRLKVTFEVFEAGGEQLRPSTGGADLFVDGQCPTDVCLPQVAYGAVMAQLCGIVVNDADNGMLEGVHVELRSADGARTLCTTTNDIGLWTFPRLQPGSYQVHFPKEIPARSLELADGQQIQSFELKAGDAKLAAAVTYQPEPHIIEQQVFFGDQPAEGVLVEVFKRGAHSALQSARTVNGLVSFVLDEEGMYEVRIHQDPQACAGPHIVYHEVHSRSRKIARIAPPPAIASTGRAGQVIGPASAISFGSGPVSELASYPVLTEEIGYPPSPLARSAGMPSSGAATPALGQIATKAISDVLGWQIKSDSKAFLGALNASFALKEVGGHTEATWTPRTYAVQTDLSGGVTGAQASVYKRAKDALDQSLPLLDGLYPLFEEAKPEDITALRATMRSQFTDLVNEFGLVGGPRIARVTKLFSLLLGQQLPQNVTDRIAFQQGGNGGPLQTDPDQILGSLGNLRQEFGVSIAADQVNTVEDEQNVTNFRIVCDYITSLAQSWLNNLGFFGLKPDATPFFGTQLVLLSRQLSVIAEKTNEVRFTLDSVFIGPADRQTLQMSFGLSDPPMFLEDLLSWIDSFASEEGPRLIAEGGKFAVGQSFVPIAEQLQRLAQGLLQPQSAAPPGFTTNRVKRALKDLADGLQQLFNLAVPISHVITPEPEPPLAVLGISPNAVLDKIGVDIVITIIGTGFDVTNPSGLTFTDSDSTLRAAISTSGILSDNLAFLRLQTGNLTSKTPPENTPYDLAIKMTTTTGASTKFATTLTVMPP